MARYRSRSRSYSPRRRSITPPRGRKHYDDEPRERYRDSRSYRDRRSPAPCGLLVRNLPLDARPEDLRVPFERYGAVKDVYLPRNYYTRQPRGFGFVKFRYAEHAAEAKQQLNHTVIGGREITIVFAEENRKTPQEMRKNARPSGRYGGSGRRRTPTRSPRRRYRSYSQSPSPARDDSRDRRYRDHYGSPERFRSYSRSPSPRGEDYRRSPGPSGEKAYRRISPTPSGEKAYRRRSPSPSGEKAYRRRSPSPSGEKDYRRRSASPIGEKAYRRSPSPRENGQSPIDKRDHTPSRPESSRHNGHSPSRSRSRSYSPR